MNDPRKRGSITIELLIAFAIFTLVASAVLLTEAGAKDAAVASGIHTDLIAVVEAASSLTINGYTYEPVSAYTYISPCLMEKVVSVARDRLQLERRIWQSDIAESFRLGGDCLAGTIPGNLAQVVSTGFSRPTVEILTAVDVSGGLTFLGGDTAPYLSVFDDESFIPRENIFSLYAKPNAIDAVFVSVDDERHHYVFAALATTTKQLAVIDVADPKNPQLVASTTLAGVDPGGFRPQGWRLMYYDQYLYISTLETAGPELHIFKMTDPTNPVEQGSGVAINITVNDFVVRKSGAKKYLYAATARDTGEIALYDVTNPSAVTEVLSARIDLPGSQDAESLYLIGDRLYVGRASNTGGPELYVYKVDTDTTFTLLGTAEIPSVSVSGIRVIGSYAYLAITPTGISTRRVDVWDVHDPVHITRSAAYVLPGLATHGIDLGESGVYAVAERDPVLRYLESK